MVLPDVLQINVSVKQRCVMNIYQASDIKHRRLCASNLLFDRLICNEHSALIILNWATGATRHCADCKIQQIRRKYQHLNIRGLDSFSKVFTRIQKELPTEFSLLYASTMSQSEERNAPVLHLSVFLKQSHHPHQYNQEDTWGKQIIFTLSAWWQDGN